jgi:hypothetical protein
MAAVLCGVEGAAPAVASYVFRCCSWGCSSFAFAGCRPVRPPLRLPQRGRFWSWPKPLVALAAPADVFVLQSSWDVLVGVVRGLGLNKKINRKRPKYH